MRNDILRAMRGVPKPDVGSIESELQNVMGDMVQVTSAHVSVLRTFGNMRVSTIHARGGSMSAPIAEQFEITCGTVRRAFSRTAFSQTRRKLRHVWRDCSPSFSAFENATTSFCVHIVQNCDIYAKIDMHAALEDRIYKDLHVLAADMQKWVAQSFDEVAPPTSIADVPPPVFPEFENVRSLVKNGAQLLYLMKTPGGGISG